MSAKRKSQESKKSTQLKTIFRASPKNILPSLEKYIKNRPDVPEICDGSMVQKMHGIVQKAVHGGTSQPSDFAGALTILQVIQHVSDFQNDPGITILLENGLLDVIADAFLSALHIIRNEEETEAEKLYDNLLETIGIIADANIESRGLVVEKFCDRLLQIITSHHFSFQIRIETLKTTNMMLEGCPLAVKEQMKKSQSHRELMRHVAHLMPNAGDYEFQVGLTECLFRMTHKADRADFAKKWFDEEEFLDAFLGIRDSDFDTDCRKFLLLVNAIENGETSVITIPANLVLLGKYKLRKPNDANYDAFWVDFNSQSRRILVFCDPDPSESQDAEDDHLWETVAIQDENVVQYAILESSGMIEVTIELNSNAMELISFGPNSSSKTVTLYFDSNCDLKNALVSTFGSGKLKQTSKKMKSSTARIPVDLQTDQFKVPKATPSEASRREQPQKQGEMIQSSQDSAMSTPRVKVSVPSVAMRICTNHTTPVLTVPHVRQSTKAQNDSPKGLPTPPKTPVQKTNTSQKKVKTPLQFTKPSPNPTTESADAMSAKGDSTSRVAARQPVRNTRKTSEKHMEEPTESQTVIPSSMPGEDFQDSIDTLHSLPALSTRKSKRHNRTHQIDDSGVCLDLTKEAPDVSRVSSHDDPKQTKKHEMSELKERLEMSDPDYCILPKNTHKVSTTPALSTVTEESVTGSIKSKDRIKKDFQMLSHNETITEILEESNSQSVQPSIEEIKETVNVNRFYSKTPQKQQMSPDSTSQSLCDNHSSNIVEVCLPPGMEINPEEYNRDSLKESKPKTNKRHSKKEPTFPDSSTTTSRPRTRSRSNVRISPKMSQDRICEVIPETQLTPVESFDIQESNQKKQTRRSGCHTTEKNSTSGLEGNRRLSSPIATGNEPPVQKSVEVSKAQTEDNWSDDDNFNLTIEDSCKEQDERVDTSFDLTNTSNAPKSYSRKNTPLKSTTLKKSVEKSKPEVVSVTKPRFFKSRLLNFSNEDKDQLNRPTCVYEFEPHVKPKGKPQTSKTKAKKPKEITNKETSPKNAVNEKEKENVEKRPAPKNNPNKNKDINKSIASPEAVEADISTNINGSNRFDELVQSMIKRSPCAKNRSVRARKQVNYKEPAESEVGSEYDMTPAVTTKRQNVNIDPYALDIPPDQQVKKKGKKKRSLFSETDETTDAKSEVSWLGSTAKKQRKPKVQKTYVHNRGNKRGRLVTAKAYHRDDPVDFHIDDSDNESVEIEKPAPPPKKKRKTKAKKVDDDDKENMVENLYFGASRTNTGTDVESLLPEFQIEDEPVLKTPNRGKQKPSIDINALFSGLGLPGTKTPRTPFKELSLNQGDWSIERCRREAPDMLPSVSQLVISPTDGPKMTSSPVNKDNLDNDGVDEEFQLDLGSQLSTCTHISTLKTPKTPKHSGKSDKDDDDDDYEELLAECDPLEEPSIPNLLQSGPSKRTRVEQKQEMRGDIIENPDSCTDAEAVNVNAAESDVEDEDEEDEDDDDQGLAALNRSTLRPRRLFSEIMSDYKNAMTTNEKCTDDDEEEEMADDERQEMGVNEEQEQESDDSDQEEEKVMMPDELKLQSGVSTLLHSFGSEITKNLFAKKNQLEEMTKDLIQTSHHQLNNVWLKEYRHRDRLMGEFKKAVLHELMELEKDVDKLRQAEDKIMVFFKEQQLIMNKTCSSQKLRLQNMVKIENAFIKDMTSTAPLVRQETSSRDILKKQMMTLQKKILHQAQQQEIQNVKRSLQNLFV